MATFFAPGGLPTGLQGIELGISGAYRAPADGPAFAHIVLNTPKGNANGFKRKLELALRGEEASFEVALSEIPGGFADSSVVFRVEVAR